MTLGPESRPANRVADGTREQRRLAAILVAQVVCPSGDAGGALDEGQREELRRSIREALAWFGGREVKGREPAVLVAFGSALDAVRCALRIQEAVAGQGVGGPGRAPSLGIGVHLGELVRREDEVLGEGVEIAGHLALLAGSGGVCISEDVYRQIHNKLDAPLTRVGRAGLTDAALPMAVYRAGGPGPAEPRLRPGSGEGRTRPRRGLTAGVLSILLAGALGLGRRYLPVEVDGAPITVAVADFVNETKEEDLDGLSGMLTTALEQSRRLSVLTRTRMFDILKQMDREGVERIDEVVGRELSERARVDALVLGTVRRFGTLYTIDLRVLDPRRNECIFTAREEGRGKESLPRMLDRLSEATRVALKENQAEIRRASLALAEHTTRDFEAYQHYFLGEQLFAKVSSNVDLEGVEAAVAEFQRAVELDPTFALAHYRLAFARLWTHDDPTGPITLAMRHLDRAPEKERLYIRACAARVQGRLDEAAALYRQVLVAYPNEKDALYALGDLEFHRWNLPPAVAHLRRALEIDPLFALAYEHLIEALVRGGELAQAQRYAWQYAERVPSEASAHWLFSILLIARPLPEVEVELRRALAAHPERLEFILGSPRLRALAGDWAGAQAELEPLLDSPRAKLRAAGLELLIWISVYQGRFREAIALHERAAREAQARGDEAGHAMGLASQAALVAWGFRDEGWLREIEAQVTGNAWAEWEVARAWGLLGRWGPALRVLGRYPVLGSTNEDYPRVLALADAGRYAEAVRGLEAIAGIPQNESFVRMEIAELASAHGDPDRVISEIDALFRWRREPGEVMGFRNFYHPRGLYLLGKAYEAKGEARRAARAYEELVVLWKDADQDLADLRDARERLARLRRSGALR